MLTGRMRAEGKKMRARERQKGRERERMHIGRLACQSEPKPYHLQQDKKRERERGSVCLPACVSR